MFEEPENLREQQENVKKYEDMLQSGSIHFMDVNVFESVVNYYQGTGKIKKAIKACTIALDQHPYSLDLFLTLAQLFNSSGETKKAFETLEQAENYFPNDYDLLR